jgi:hypothetical protein
MDSVLRACGSPPHQAYAALNVEAIVASRHAGLKSWVKGHLSA